MKRVLMLLIRGYQLIVSPWLGPRCRFYPSCSRYAYQAVSTHGAVRGTGLAAWRVLRCNPWNPGGIDPVPPRRNAKPDPGHRHHASATDEHSSGARPAETPATPGPDHTRGA